MKKTMIFAAAAAMFMFASCQKEEALVQNSQSDELVFTATIVDQATRTIVNTDASSANRGKVSWEVNDEISVTDGANSAVYYIKDASDIAADGSAAFTYKSGTRPSKDAASYSATYGNAITTAQTYSATAGKLPMTGTSDSGNKTKLNFTVTCGLLKLNLTASGDNAKDISKIEIVGTPTGGSASVYTLICDNVSIASAKDFYIALPAGSYNLMKFINSKGCVCFKKATTAMAIEANKIQPVTLSDITFSAVLPGKFDVLTKDVQFSAANLYWGGSYYALETAQTAYPKTWDANHVGHFFWTKTAAASYAASYSDGTCTETDKFFADGSNADHQLTVDAQSGLYALSYAEWHYLLSPTGSGGRGDGDSKFKCPVTVNGVANCLVIAPNGYTGIIASSYDAAAWAAAEASGLVCLPAAGSREGSVLCDEEFGNWGNYWLSTPCDSDEDYACVLYFNDGKQGEMSNPETGGISDRFYGFSLRLVK